MHTTQQMQKWRGEFGEQYTNRCFRTTEDDNRLSLKHYGIARMQLYEEFVGDLDRGSRILEIGCNIGNKLSLLHLMGFTELFGIEVQRFAIEKGKQLYPHINFSQASIFELPFRDDSFDLVFTSGLLIHIPPDALPNALRETYRCSRKYIWGFEYYHDELIEIDYRGNAEMMWKGNYTHEYAKNFPRLKTVKEKQIPYLANNNRDCMFLLEK